MKNVRILCDVCMHSMVIALCAAVAIVHAEDFTCSMVCGFSTTGQWYKNGEFEKILGDDRWQCLFQGGAGAEGWMRPQFVGYSRFKKKSEVTSPCKANWNKPDRIVYQISSNPTLTNLDTWEKNIEGAVRQILAKFPSAKQVIMMAVPGGPNHKRCSARDSWMHVYVDSGIARVAKKKIPKVYVGLSHEVSKCSDYSDGKGHVNRAGGRALGRQAGEFYKKWDEEETWKWDPNGYKPPDYYSKSRPGPSTRVRRFVRSLVKPQPGRPAPKGECFDLRGSRWPASRIQERALPGVIVSRRNGVYRKMVLSEL